MSLIVTGGLGGFDGADAELLLTGGLGAPGPPSGVFAVDSATQGGPSVVRVRFGAVPLIGDPTDVTDALNPGLYTLAGPGGAVGTPAVVMSVPEDPTFVDVFVFEVLAPGNWTITVASSLLALSGATLTTPRSAAFTIAPPVIGTAVAGGAVEESLIRRLLNPALRGSTWDALIAALDRDHEILADLARAAYDQTSPASASGPFLDLRMGELDVRRPAGVGMDDPAFRKLGLALANDRVTRRAFYNLLEAFYEADATRATATTTVPEPFPLRHGDQLNVLLGESRRVTVSFDRAEFAKIARASAAEVAAAVNRAAADRGVRLRAAPWTDTTTGLVFVRLYADARGLASTIRVEGGRAQLALLFPTPLFPTAAAPFGVWDIDLSPADLDRTRFTLTGSSTFDLEAVRPGDYVIVEGQEFDDALHGTAPVLAVSVTYPGPVRWFEIPRIGGLSVTQLGGVVIQLGVVQRAATSLSFHRATLRTIHDASRRALVLGADGVVDLVLPTTSAAVRRGVGRAAYPPDGTAVAVASLARGAGGVGTAQTGAAHGLVVGDRVRLEGVAFGTAAPATVPGSACGSIAAPPVTRAGQTDAGFQTVASAAGSYEGVHGAAALLGDGFVLLAGGKTDHGTPTPATTPAFFRLTGLADGGGGRVRLDYEFRRPTTAVSHAEFCQAVTLTDAAHVGQALVTGGSNNLGAASSATTLIAHRLLPAETTTATVLGTMGVGRAMHRTTVLPDGKVLVTGGFTTYPTPLATCQRWDPVAQTWGAAASMSRARMDHGQAALPDGRVLVAGGRAGATAALSFCEIYDPGANTWSRTGNLTTARYGHALVVLPSGRVLAVGGRGHNPTNETADAALARAEIFDPASGAWLPAGETASSRERPAAVYIPASSPAFPGGVVLVQGGDTNTLELFDVARFSWRPSLAALAAVKRGALGVYIPGTTAALFAGGESVGSVTAEGSAIVVVGAEAVLGGGAGGVVRVTAVPSPTSFSYATTVRAVGAAPAATATPTAAPFAGNRGPYLFDPAGLPATATRGTLAAPLEAGRRYPSLTLTGSTAAFPDEEGWLVLRLGRAGEIGPIRYLGRLSGTQLRLDASFEFPSSCATGDDVTLLAGRTVSPIPPELGTYLTPGTAGRVAASALADDVVAGGIRVRRTILYPSDRGLGGEGRPTRGAARLSGIVSVFAGDDVSAELQAAREDV